MLKYRAFCDEVRLKRVTVNNGDAITFVVPFPKSYSKRKRARLVDTIHSIKPDLDNYLKALLDAIYDDDSHIGWLGELKKVWGEKGAIIIKRNVPINIIIDRSLEEKTVTENVLQVIEERINTEDIKT